MNKPEYLHSGSLDIHTEPELSDPADDRGSRPWLTVIKSAGVRNARIEQWFSECVLWGHEALQNSVEIDPKRRESLCSREPVSLSAKHSPNLLTAPGYRRSHASSISMTTLFVNCYTVWLCSQTDRARDRFSIRRMPQ